MTDPVLAAALVGVGGAVGAMARHAVGLRIAGRRSVVVVNTLGSLALGAVLSAPIGANAALFVAVGVCGAFTTFSSFAVETVSTAADGDTRVAAGFAAVNLALALGAFLLGTVAVGRIASVVAGLL
ncbi:Camphor resistance CrcB protein [Halorubrum aidingense JCM 13560]|uniref:Fluoride-specific ion channel FluC n=1 Tax=Halorubrum aidingense JCM 13560 TaxID=1230454 RepID=M0P5R9_9EURY|nr:CrcB family protein [Halorubrum aidingense]EMA65168.1 Camphor resistance CrcB protein [Halorubrum aidingense JCM 13560]